LRFIPPRDSGEGDRRSRWEGLAPATIILR
jgi:hypothetical protein